MPWAYAIARRVRIDGYRRTRRITRHEVLMDRVPERPLETEQRDAPVAFDALVLALPESQREVITMLKVGGLSLEEVARATSSTVGAVKQKAHRAYGRLRQLFQGAQI
jgi:RNA polymerase sigma-70 factor (ECF subfamily)